MKAKIHVNGTIIEAEGTAEEITQLIREIGGKYTPAYPQWPPYLPQVTCVAGTTADVFAQLAKREDVRHFSFTPTDTNTRIDTCGPAEVLVYHT